MSSRNFTSFAATAAILAAVAILSYTVTFLQLKPPQPILYSMCLMLMGLLTGVASIGVFMRLRPTDEGFALLALVLSLAGALGAFLHGGYDLANAIVPPATGVPADLPSAIDPRGVATFGLAGLGLILNAWLIMAGGRLPKGLGWLGVVLGALLVEIYFARMILISPANPMLLVPVLLTGYLLNPLYNLWLGRSLWSAKT